jgi:iron complex outermembrane recepter protein
VIAREFCYPGFLICVFALFRTLNETESLMQLNNAKIRYLSNASLALFSAVYAVSAVAQTEPAATTGKLEDVVVTAQRRAESVQSIPVSVSAFSPAELERRNIDNTLDLVQYVPNLIGHNNTGLGSANVYYLRGLGNTESIATFDPPVGTYVDDVYIARQNANNFALFDVERIEVLRGPQGTLFGRNTTGGAINVILKKPGKEFAGYAEAGYGRFNEVALRGSLDIPFSDGFSSKISGYFTDDSGFVRNVTTGEKINDKRNYGIRGAVRALLTDTVTWDVAADFVSDDSLNLLNSKDSTVKRVSFSNYRKGNACAPTVTNEGDKALLNCGLGSKTKSTSITSNIGFGMGSADLNFILGYRNTQQDFVIDFFDGRPGYDAINNVRLAPTATGRFAIGNNGDHNQFSAELKATGAALDDRLKYVGGLFYLKEDNTTRLADVFGAFGRIADRTLDNTTESKAAYLQLDFNPTDQLTVTAGIRYTDDKKDLAFVDNRATCPVAATAVSDPCLTTENLRSIGIPTVQNNKLWTPRFALNFNPMDDILLFASATRGFKSGGWNARNTGLQARDNPATPQNDRFTEIQPFGIETVWSYEAGIKSEFLDKTLRFNLTGFYSDVSNFQVPSAFVRANGSIAFITQNFADMRNYGAELEVTWLPVEHLTLYLTGGYQNAKYTNPAAAVLAQQANCRADIAAGVNPYAAASRCTKGIVSPSGALSNPVRTPDFTASLGGNYELELGGFTLIPAANLSWVGKQTVGTSSGRNALVGSYTLVNASLALQTEDKMWKISAECDNCFNTTYVNSTLADFPYINQPSRWRVKAKYSF